MTAAYYVSCLVTGMQKQTLRYCCSLFSATTVDKQRLNNIILNTKVVITITVTLISPGWTCCVLPLKCLSKSPEDRRTWPIKFYMFSTILHLLT